MESTPELSSHEGARPEGGPAMALMSALRSHSPICVGLDPVLSRLPDSIRPASDDPAGVAAAFPTFSSEILQCLQGVVGCVKIQAACYERFGPAGYESLARTCTEARDLGFIVILDAKRGDIGISAEHYAASACSMGAHWITINPYLGNDGILPFLESGLGAFALVRTSNPGGDAIQSESIGGACTVAEHVASCVHEIGSDFVDSSGYSALGAVVGATKGSQVARMRELMPAQPFLVPGFGAQGGTAADVMACFDASGLGAIITASRSVIYAYSGDQPDWSGPVRESAERMKQQLQDELSRQESCS
ncbi:MAG: orotidine-5'-phosphate decarboxylase [Phycisphaerae bacterium]|nr:orotidine-5'-phosphate decarboxylase [Phycisphaerae bacterium]